MTSLTNQEAEHQIRTATVAGDLRSAASLALETFGPEVVRFLRARLRTQTQAEDAFLQFSEDFWVGLQTFRWDASIRVWMFVLARNAATRVGRAQRREAPLEIDRDVHEEVIERARTSTAVFMQTAVKDRMREIRLLLSEEDQSLLVLRIDRHLGWRELALVLEEVGPDASESELTRAAARLRTRFQTAKLRLRKLAEAEGLVRRSSDSSAGSN